MDFNKSRKVAVHIPRQLAELHAHVAAKLRQGAETAVQSKKQTFMSRAN